MIYIEPRDLWDKFEANKTILPGHYLACAEEDGKSIKLSVEEGDLLLIYDGEDGYVDEVFDNEADAIYAYEEMLNWLSEPAEDGPEDDPDVPEDPEISDQLLAPYCPHRLQKVPAGGLLRVAYDDSGTLAAQRHDPLRNNNGIIKPAFSAAGSSHFQVPSVSAIL